VKTIGLGWDVWKEECFRYYLWY